MVMLHDLQRGSQERSWEAARAQYTSLEVLKAVMETGNTITGCTFVNILKELSYLF